MSIKKSEHRPPERPDIQTEKTRFISLRDLNPKEQVYKEEEPKLLPPKVIAGLVLVLALGVTSVTVIVKRDAKSQVMIEDVEPMDFEPRAIASAKHELPSSNRAANMQAPMPSTDYQPRPSYEGYTPVVPSYSYPDDVERTPAYAEYDTDMQTEPMPPQEEFVPPVEEFIE